MHSLPNLGEAISSHSHEGQRCCKFWDLYFDRRGSFCTFLTFNAQSRIIIIKTNVSPVHNLGETQLRARVRVAFFRKLSSVCFRLKQQQFPFRCKSPSFDSDVIILSHWRLSSWLGEKMLVYWSGKKKKNHLFKTCCSAHYQLPLWSRHISLHKRI